MEFEDLAIVVLLITTVYVGYQVVGYLPKDGDSRSPVDVAHKVNSLRNHAITPVRHDN